MDDLLQVPVSRGYLAKLCSGTISDFLRNAYEDLTEAIPQQQQRSVFMFLYDSIVANLSGPPAPSLLG
jgi:hypothetical protein